MGEVAGTVDAPEVALGCLELARLTDQLQELQLGRRDTLVRSVERIDEVRGCTVEHGVDATATLHARL